MADGGLHFTASIDTANFMRQMEQVKSQMKQFSADVEKQGGSIDAVFDRLTKAAASFGVAFSVKEVVSKVAQVRGEFQQLEVAFETMLGNKSKANALMSQLVETAAITPFGLNDVANGAKQLLAYGTEAEKVNDTLVRLGDIAAGLSIPLNDLTYLYGTTMVQGRMYTQDLNQFLGRGIPLVDELANQFGVTKDKVKGLVEEGKVGFPEVEKAIISMTSEGSKFGGLMAEQSKTISGQIGNIEDAIDSMFNEIGKQSEGIINTGLAITSALVENWQKVGEAIGVAITAYGSYKAILMTVTAYQKANMAVLTAAAMEKKLAAAASVTLSNAEAVAIARTKLLTLAQQGLIKALKSVTAATIANPYVLAAAAITGLVYGIYKYVTAETAAEKAQRTLNERLDEAKKKQEEYNNETKEAISTIQDETKATEDKDQAMQMLIARYPEIIKKYIDEKGHLRDILKLKEEIANYDANRQRTETTETLRATGENAWSNYNNAIKILKAQSRSGGLTKDEQAIAKQLESQYKKDTGTSGAGMLITSMSDIRDYYKNLAATSRKAYNRKLTENRISDFTKEGGALEGYSDEALRKLQQRLRNGQTKKNAEDLKNGKDHALYYEELGDYLNYNDRASLLTRIEGMLNARSEAKGSSSDWVTRLKKDYDAKLKEYTDYISNKGNKVSLAEFEKKSAELKSAADDAKNKYDSAKGGSSTSSAKTDLKKEQDEYSKLVNENAQKRIRESQDLQMKVDQANIDAMKGGTDKTIAQLELDFEKQMQEIDRQKEDLLKSRKDEAKDQFDKDPANKGKTFDGSDIKLTDQEIQNFDQLYNAAINNYLSKKKEIDDQESQSINDYLIQYGTYLQKKLALEEEYAKKIQQAQTIGEKMSLQEELKGELSEINTAVLDKAIDWEAVFNNIDNLSTEYLEKLKKQLKEALSSNDITAESASVIASQINKIDEQIISKKKAWKSAFGLVIPELEKIRQYERESQAAQEAKNQAEERYKETLSAVADKQKEIAGYLKDNGIDADSSQISTENSGTFIDMFKKLGKSSDELSNKFQDLGSKEQDASKASEQYSKAATIASSFGGSGGSGGSGGAGGAATTVAIIDKIIHTINDNVQSMVDLLEEIGESESKFGKGWSSFAQSSTYATNGWESLKKGDLVGVASNVLGSLRTLGDALGKWGLNSIFGSSDVGLAEYIEDASVSINALKESVDQLADKMDDASSLEEIQSNYEKQVAYLTEAMDTTQTEMMRSGDVSSKGFLGIGSKGSSNYYINENMSVKDWLRISEITGTSVRNAADFWNLTSEQMSDVSTYASDLYAKIKTYADDGAGDAAQFMDTYIEYYQELEELENTHREKLTTISFDSITDTFADTLADWDSEASDFAEDFEEMMRNAVVNALMVNKYKPLLEDWYKQFADAMKDDDLSKTEVDDLKRVYDDIVSQARDEVNSLYDTLGITEVSEQSASSKSFSTMSQDTADELNGRFTALQESNEIIKEQMLASVEGSQSLLTVTTEGNNILNSILLQHVATNTHLEDLVKYTKPLLEFGAKLDKLIDQTKNI